MTYFASGQRDCLHYKLKGNPTDIAPWGHEFVRYEIIRVPPRMLTRKSALAAEVAQEFSIRREAKQPVDDLLNLVGEIIPFGMLKLPSNTFTHNRLQTLVIMQNPMHAIF